MTGALQPGPTQPTRGSCNDPRETCAAAGGVLGGGIGAGLLGLVLTKGTSVPPWEVFLLLFLTGVAVGLGVGVYAHCRWQRAGHAPRCPHVGRAVRRLSTVLVLAWATCAGVSAAPVWLFVAGIVAVPLLAILFGAAAWLVCRAVADVRALRSQRSATTTS